MRADAAGARTWLLGALALWALSFWVLALAGMGTRIERLPADPALLQPLPVLPEVAPERLALPPQYATIGDRPLFTDDRRPQPFFINAENNEQQNTFDYVLTSVLISPGLRMAILRANAGGEPVRLKVGESPESAPAWSLDSVSPRSVVFAGPEGSRTLELRVFDGTGGEPPTVVAAPRPPVPAPRPPSPVTATQPAITGADASVPAAQPPPKPATTTVPPQAPPAPAPVAAVAPEPTPEAQVEAIRQRIEARRAQLREQVLQQSQPPQAPAPDQRP